MLYTSFVKIMFRTVVAVENKRVEISSLLEYYRSLLSDRQRDVLDLYYNDDLSLAEIAEDTGITRQGVRDAIKKGEKALFEFEKLLGLAERAARLEKIAAELEALGFDDIAKRLSDVI